MRILHTMLRVGDLERAIHFYTEVLGMQLLRRSENPEYRYSLAFVGYEGNPAQAARDVVAELGSQIDRDAVKVRAAGTTGSARRLIGAWPSIYREELFCAAGCPTRASARRCASMERAGSVFLSRCGSAWPLRMPRRWRSCQSGWMIWAVQ